MQLSVRLAAALPSLFLSCCSVYPLPEDYSGSTGEQISNLTRCQIGDGVKEEIVRLVESERYKDQIVYGTSTGTEFSSWLKSDINNFAMLDWRNLRGRAGYAISFYRYTVVAIDYSLEGSEINKSGVGGTLLRTLTKGSNTFGFSATNDLTRTVKSDWRTFDTFESLLKRPASACKDAPRTANLLYPSTGLSRVASIVRRFVGFNERQNLATKEDPSVGSLSDTITYITKANAKFTPSFKLPGSTNDLIATEIAPGLDYTRQDQHIITVLVKQASSKPTARFDAFGRLTNLTQEQARRLDAEAELDRVQSRNAQDSLSQIGRSLSRMSE